MKILLAADGSIYTRRAVNYLVRDLDILGRQPEIHLLNVRPPLPGRAAAALGRAIVRRYYGNEARKALALAKRTLNRHRISYKEVHRIGGPGELIAAYAKKGKFSLVVMGSHGRGALTNLMLGSVASKVLANCKVPVLIIR